jgi:hypothetical protein
MKNAIVDLALGELDPEENKPFPKIGTRSRL